MIFMSKRAVLLESECDYSIFTEVHLGKTIKDVPSGWALNLLDIRDFIPILRYEFECYIRINNIISPCKIRINPRLFYNGTPMKEHLRKQKSIDPNKKIELELKFNKKELDKVLNEFHNENLNYIDTKLLAGKSATSKGWGLSKDVKAQIFPLDAYNYMYPVYIDGIPAETRLNMQIRLFYSSDELSQELAKLAKRDSKQKVDARIILNEEYLHITRDLKDDYLSDQKCIICGNLIDKESQSNKCFDCLDKELTVLKLKGILDFFNPSDTFFEEDLLDLGYTKGQIMVTFHKLEKYGLVTRNWDDSFQLKDDETINKFIKEWG